MTEIKNEIWILADNRPGTFLQSVGLAEELGIEYKIIDLTYIIFSALPNFLLSNSLLRLSPQSQKSLQDFNYLPKIIILRAENQHQLHFICEKNLEIRLKLFK